MYEKGFLLIYYENFFRLLKSLIVIFRPKILESLPNFGWFPQPVYKSRISLQKSKRYINLRVFCRIIEFTTIWSFVYRKSPQAQFCTTFSVKICFLLKKVAYLIFALVDDIAMTSRAGFFDIMAASTLQGTFLTKNFFVFLLYFIVKIIVYSTISSKKKKKTISKGMDFVLKKQ